MPRRYTQKTRSLPNIHVKRCTSSTGCTIRILDPDPPVVPQRYKRSSFPGLRSEGRPNDIYIQVMAYVLVTGEDPASHIVGIFAVSAQRGIGEPQLSVGRQLSGLVKVKVPARSTAGRQQVPVVAFPNEETQAYTKQSLSHHDSKITTKGLDDGLSALNTPNLRIHRAIVRVNPAITPNCVSSISPQGVEWPAPRFQYKVGISVCTRYCNSSLYLDTLSVILVN